MSLEDLRRQYALHGLSEVDLPKRPLEFFSQWMQTAVDHAFADWVEPYAMTLATSSVGGVASVRIVLLRGFDEMGFVFYTNYDSRKGKELAENPQASLVFYWGYLERQVRITGCVGKIDRSLSETYFRQRPRGSQISAAISDQSETVSGRDELEQRAQQLESELAGQEVPIPENWGGYRLEPVEIEFWQGRPNRLHDRILYKRDDQSNWSIARLNP